MKKLILALGITLALTASLAFTPSKANAGVITLIGFGLQYDKSPIDSIAGVIISGPFIWVGATFTDSPTPYLHYLGIALVILDTDQELQQESMVQLFAKRYPFIDDREALTHLAALVKAGISASGAMKQEMNVRIPAIEVRKVLENTSLTPEQISHIVSDLG